VLLLVVPADVAIKELSAAATPAALAVLAGLMAWVGATVLGHHDPRAFPNPVRLSLLALWIPSLLSFVALHLDQADPLLVRGGDRWIFRLLTWTAVIVLASEFVRTMEDLQRILRTLAWSGAVMGLVALVQYRLRIDLAVYLRQIPGFTVTNETLGIDGRGSLARVAGTALHPIELGVTAATLLPLAIVAALHRGAERHWSRWVPVILIGVAIPVSVSRSAIIATVVSMGILIVCLDARRRLIAMAFTPVALAAVFIGTPGLLGTLKSFFLMGSDDSSISKRQRQVPLVEQLVTERPLFGRGGGTWLPPTSENILDNQYYLQTIELGLAGSIVLTLGFYVLPAATALVARHRSRNEDLRLVGGALCGASAVSFFVALTFDSMGYSMYAGVHALIVGLIGAYWLIVRNETTSDPGRRTPGSGRLDAAPSPSGR
jgi:hypothetical protein